MLCTAPNVKHVPIAVHWAEISWPSAGLLLRNSLPIRALQHGTANALALTSALGCRQTSFYGISRRRSCLPGCHCIRVKLKDWHSLQTTFISCHWEAGMMAGKGFPFLRHESCQARALKGVLRGYSVLLLALWWHLFRVSHVREAGLAHQCVGHGKMSGAAHSEVGFVTQEWYNKCMAVRPWRTASGIEGYFKWDPMWDRIRLLLRRRNATNAHPHLLNKRQKPPFHVFVWRLFLNKLPTRWLLVLICREQAAGKQPLVLILLGTDCRKKSSWFFVFFSGKFLSNIKKQSILKPFLCSVVVWNVSKREAVCGSPASARSAGNVTIVECSACRDEMFVTAGR